MDRAAACPTAEPQPRELVPPTTAATLNLARATAQGARVFEPFDQAFSQQLLTAAGTAWDAAHANPIILQHPGGVGGGAYDDQIVDDEFYRAAAQLFITTGKREYRNFILTSPLHWADVFSVDGFDWGHVAALARIQLATVPNDLPFRFLVKASVILGAEKHLRTLKGSAWQLPYAPENDNFTWGSNNLVLNTTSVRSPRTSSPSTGTRR